MMYEYQIKEQLKKIIQSLSGDIAQDIEKVKLIIVLDKLLSPDERNTFVGKELEEAKKNYERIQGDYSGKARYIMDKGQFKINKND